MIKSKLLVTIALLGAGLAAYAQDLNFDPNLPAPAPILNAGWNADTVNQPWVNSVDSPYNIFAAAPEKFTITDAFIAGDNYFVFDFGVLILKTAAPGGPGIWTADPNVAYADGGFSEGSVMLGVGPHVLTVQSDIATGFMPAGFFDRLDSVPDGGMTAGLLGLGMLALGFVRRSIK